MHGLGEEWVPGWPDAQVYRSAALQPCCFVFPGYSCQVLRCVQMEKTETRQRRPDDLGLPQVPLIGRVPAASEEELLSTPESPRLVTRHLGPDLSKETTWSIVLQVTVPFMFSGLGMSGAGMLLNYYQVRVANGEGHEGWTLSDPRNEQS